MTRTHYFRTITVFVAVSAAVVTMLLMSVSAGAVSRVFVTDVSPDGGATSVAADSNITATFSKAMRASSINGTTFYLKKESSSTTIPAQLTYNSTSKTATLNPQSNLEAGAEYTATIKGGKRGVKASNGDRLGGTRDGTATFANGKVTWTFTVEVVDTIAPSVSSVSPEDTATGVALSTNVEAAFSEAMDQTTLNTSTFTLKKQNDTTAIPATVSYEATTNTVMLNPAADLEEVTTYTATIKGGTGGAEDAADNPLIDDKTWSFTTADTTPPETTIDSDSGPTGTVSSGSASFNFSSSEANSSFECSLNSASFAGCTSPKNYTGLADGSYTFKVRAKDAAGNIDPTPASRTWTVDTTKPTVSSVTPSSGATNVAANTNAEATFSEAMDSSSITDRSFTLSKNGSPVEADVTYVIASQKATLNPDSDLEADTTYTATITTSVKDSVGNTLEEEYTWSFKTAPPVVITPSPLDFTPNTSACNTTITKAVTITNNSADEVELFPSVTNPHYSVASDSLHIPSGESLELSVSWTAPNSGFRISDPGTLDLKDAAGNTIATNQLKAFINCGIEG